jgi:hypothetical protein
MLPISDDHHFDLTGYKLWAERALASITQAGWPPGDPGLSPLR